MSWSFEASGKKEDVKAVVDKQEHCPPKVREFVKDAVDGLNLEDGGQFEYGAYAKSYGHIDSGLGGNATIEVRRVLTGTKSAT